MDMNEIPSSQNLKEKKNKQIQSEVGDCQFVSSPSLLGHWT
jgi:hypothetical protein